MHAKGISWKSQASNQINGYAKHFLLGFTEVLDVVQYHMGVINLSFPVSKHQVLPRDLPFVFPFRGLEPKTADMVLQSRFPFGRADGVELILRGFESKWIKLVWQSKHFRWWIAMGWSWNETLDYIVYGKFLSFCFTSMITFVVMMFLRVCLPIL